MEEIKPKRKYVRKPATPPGGAHEFIIGNARYDSQNPKIISCDCTYKKIDFKINVYITTGTSTGCMATTISLISCSTWHKETFTKEDDIARKIIIEATTLYRKNIEDKIYPKILEFIFIGDTSIAYAGCPINFNSTSYSARLYTCLSTPRFIKWLVLNKKTTIIQTPVIPNPNHFTKQGVSMCAAWIIFNPKYLGYACIPEGHEVGVLGAELMAKDALTAAAAVAQRIGMTPNPRAVDEIWQATWN
jgi:hypothetical protein